MRKSRKKTTVILVIILIIGLSLMLYPSVANYWNSYHASKAIASYIETVENGGGDRVFEMIEDAKEYNKELADHQSAHDLSDSEKKKYESTLDITGTGIMGYVDVPSIDCTLPIYHGTEEASLQTATGHLEWTSFPVGGESTHAVLSGHRGLPSAKLFSRLDQLQAGDYFMIYIGKEILTYKVDQIRIVLPDETNDLKIVEGKDYATLVTCTPYGINTHRLLVRGERTENIYGQEFNLADAVEVDKMIVAAVLGIIMLLLLTVWLLIATRKRGSRCR